MKIIIIVFCAFIMVFILSCIIKRRNEKKTKELIAGDKIREEALDKLLLNQESEMKKDEKMTFAAVPVEVDYGALPVEKSKKSQRRKEKQKKVMLQIVEINELSSRKYMLDPVKGIYIGSKNGKNHIVISNSNVDDRQCEIRENAQRVYVRNIGSSGRVILKRGKQSAYVEKKYLELKNQDGLLIGNVLYRIDLIYTN